MKDDIKFVINGEEISLEKLVKKMDGKISRAELTAWILGVVTATTSISLTLTIVFLNIYSNQIDKLESRIERLENIKLK